MNTCQECPSKQAPSFSLSGLMKVWLYIKTMAIRIHKWERIKQSHHILLRMDDRMLDDIGLSRADVVRISKDFSFWQYLFHPDREKES